MYIYFAEQANRISLELDHFDRISCLSLSERGKFCHGAGNREKSAEIVVLKRTDWVDPARFAVTGGQRVNAQSAWDVSQQVSGAGVVCWEKLNSAVLFISKDLNVTIYNDLARDLLNTAGSLGLSVPLADCVSPDSEEYQTLAQMIAVGREFRDFISRWEVDGRVRHVLIDSFMPADVDHKDRSGMYLVVKDLGNFSTLEQQVQRTEKLSTIGKVAAGVAHEIRNPLTTVKGFLQMMRQQFEESGERMEMTYADVMLGELERVDSLVSELLLLSKPRQMERRLSCVANVFDDLTLGIRSEATLRGIAVEMDLDRTLCACIDINLMRQVLSNLVKNAFEAMDKEGTLQVGLSRFRRWVRIDISDSGPGIPYYQMDKIFDAFFTTKDKGMGLGLPISQKIVDDHGGEIRVSSKGFGTTFSVLLPGSEESVPMAVPSGRTKRPREA